MTDRMKTVRFLDRERSANMPAEKKEHLSGRELLGVYESDTAIVRIYTGPMTDTPEKRRALLEKAAQRYAGAIRRSNPELFEQISWAAT